MCELRGGGGAVTKAGSSPAAAVAAVGHAWVGVAEAGVSVGRTMDGERVPGAVPLLAVARLLLRRSGCASWRPACVRRREDRSRANAASCSCARARNAVSTASTVTADGAAWAPTLGAAALETGIGAPQVTQKRTSGGG